MKQSPFWEANMSSATQAFPRVLRNQKVHHRIHNSPPPVPILSKIDPVYAPKFKLSKIHFNIIHLGFPSGLLPSGFTTKYVYAPLLSAIRATCRAYLCLLDLIHRMTYREEYRA